MTLQPRQYRQDRASRPRERRAHCMRQILIPQLAPTMKQQDAGRGFYEIVAPTGGSAICAPVLACGAEGRKRGLSSMTLGGQMTGRGHRLSAARRPNTLTTRCVIVH